MSQDLRRVYLKNPSPLTPLPQVGEGNLNVGEEKPRKVGEGNLKNVGGHSPSPAGGRGVGERVKQVLLTRAKTMRSNQTDAEQCLWFHLRAQRLTGLKFKRQKPVGSFIVDFICLEIGLIVEADGSQHGDMTDRQRDDWLRQNGYTVLHFWNNDILLRTEAVLESIWQTAIALSAALPSPPTPLPQVGEGSKVRQEDTP